jgi:uncharacterized protein YndB with AHSA1/START domain
MAASKTITPNGKATTIKSTFWRQTEVGTQIKADASVVWALLTNAADYPRWNPTVIGIEGNIAQGEKIKLTSTLSPKRVFTLAVKEFEPNKKLVWGDAMGKRVFTLTPGGAGSLTFTMGEKIGGPLFPLFAGMIPAFDDSFEQFAASLTKEAEAIMHAK